MSKSIKFLQRTVINKAAAALALIILIACVAKFYHHNYIANTSGQAKKLRLPGFNEYFCKGLPVNPGAIDQCGKRSIFKDSDWGITAYFTLYGVDTRAEAEAITNFMVDARIRNKQNHIPMNVQIYSVPRSAGGFGPVSKQYLIFNKDF